MNDGANLGITAGDALDSILGGKKAESTLDNSPEGMRAYLMGAHTEEELMAMNPDEGYNEASRYAGKMILEVFDAHPEIAEHTKPSDAYDAIEVLHPKFLDGLGLSEFMVGWGLNAAKIAFGKKAGSNPALVTVELP